MDTAAQEGVTAMVFGDLFLEDVRLYRERAMAPTWIEPIFPLWSRPTGELARQMISDGVRAVLTCVDPAQLSPSFVGRAFDQDLLNDLPSDVDPCGERGEFHTFVWDAPSFRSPIPIQTGEIVTRDGFVFCDVIPAGD
jgi:diphthamide synthase (EF-2-diphthine--ammonia ligase)